MVAATSVKRLTAVYLHLVGNVEAPDPNIIMRHSTSERTMTRRWQCEIRIDNYPQLKGRLTAMRSKTVMIADNCRTGWSVAIWSASNFRAPIAAA